MQNNLHKYRLEKASVTHANNIPSQLGGYGWVGGGRGDHTHTHTDAHTHQANDATATSHNVAERFVTDVTAAAIDTTDVSVRRQWQGGLLLGAISIIVMEMKMFSSKGYASS